MPLLLTAFRAHSEAETGLATLRVITIQVQRPGLACVTALALHVRLAHAVLLLAGVEVQRARRIARARLALGIVAVAGCATLAATPAEPGLATAVARTLKFGELICNVLPN